MNDEASLLHERTSEFSQARLPEKYVLNQVNLCFGPGYVVIEYLLTGITVSKFMLELTNAYLSMMKQALNLAKFILELIRKHHLLIARMNERVHLFLQAGIESG